MAETQGDTPENRRYADPFDPMSAGFGGTMRASGHCDDDPHPQITTAEYESDAGQPLPSRPERAAANNVRFAHPSDIKFGQIEPPCG